MTISTSFDGITETSMISGRSSYFYAKRRGPSHTFGPVDHLQPNRLRLAARGLERAPTVAREARRADSRNP